MEEAQKKNGFNKPLRIAVVGGGLVGSLCACFMAKRGFTVDLYEYREDIRKADLVKGRSINLSMSNRARAALSVIGLEDHMVNEHGIPMCGRLIHKTNGSLRAIPYDVLSKQCIYSVGRKYLNEVLLSAAEKYSNVNLHFNHKLINARLNEGKLTLLRTDTNSTIEIEADLVIGADGAFSTVRKHMMKMPMFDFSQTYIETGYLELCIPPDEDGKFQINPNYLHIWPRGEFMMIALPNQDCSYTVTLFMPFGEFRSLRTSDQLLDFFDVNFPDAVPLIGRDRLVNDFFGTTPSPLVSIKCKPYHLGNRCVIIGDAAHAMVPFYGQGMNAGFEDCLLLDKLLDEHRCDMTTVLRSFTEMRVDDAHTICDLAMYNYVEMRDLVTRKSFLIRKKVDDILYRTIPTKWVPLYNSVTFTDLGYLQCLKNRKWQNKVLTRVGLQLPVAVALICLILFMYYRTFLNNNYFFEKILTFNS